MVQTISKKKAVLKRHQSPAKIINDPVHGFIEVPKGTLLNLIDTPIFQRLRRIKQLGQSAFVYPGAVHTRFNHALGAMHLMRLALDVLRRKHVEITDEEYEATLIAILMHDIGHGPFSHALERDIIQGLHHENMSLALMGYLNQQFEGRLSLAISIFNGNYHKPFLHQLISSQLDMDRMDYLIRDSFFTGVAEGIIGTDRIIKTMNVYDNQLVFESKAIYSIEKFIIARRLMYWQVYLHKAAVAAEYMMVNILQRARLLFEQGKALSISPTLAYFFREKVSPTDLNDEVIEQYIKLDDTDIESSIKNWQDNKDRVLSVLSNRIVHRKLLKIELRNEEFTEEEVDKYRREVMRTTGFTENEIDYFVFTGKVHNQAYLKNSSDPILIWHKSGLIQDLAQASDMQNIDALSQRVSKSYLCHPQI